MVPNIQSPIDRSERFRQRAVANRAPRAKVRGGMRHSSIPCDLCQAACNQLSGIPKMLCQAACSAVC